MSEILSDKEIDQLLKGLSDYEVDYKEYCKHKMPCGLCDITKEKCEVQDE